MTPALHLAVCARPSAAFSKTASRDTATADQYNLSDQNK
jgi:hypothetical protein